ncbi:MAG TPA: hypothetical protein VN743_05020 [Blastocatellia bacterium]|nr:hypothetical protein [Blastocatellia bacterium]
MRRTKTPYWEQRLAKINERLGSEVAARMNEIRQRIPQAGDEETLALCRALRVGYRAYLYNPANLSRVRDRCDVSPASIRNGIITARATLDSLGDWDFRPQLSQLKMPALVLEGAQTEVPLQATRDWVATIPNARLFLVPNSGDELWAEQPTIFIATAEQFLMGKYPEGSERVLNRTTKLREDQKNSQHPEKLALGQCEDTNVNFFLPVMEAKSLIPAVVGAPIVTPLFGGNTTPLNVAHFHCATASIGGRPLAAINFVLIRLGLSTSGHYVMHVMTDSRPFQRALGARGITSHFVTNASLDIAGRTWTTKWGGNFSPYSVVAHQINSLPTSSGRIDWIFYVKNGIVRITGTHTLTEEFGDRNPIVSVPEDSALRPFFNHSRGVTALTHRMSLDLTLSQQQ